MHPLDDVFAALSAAPRRDLLARLRTGPRTVSDLATGRPMTVQAISKHLKVLEKAGLVTKQRRGKEVLCALNPSTLQGAADWIAVHRQLWDDSLGRLDALLMDMKAKGDSR
ncbi:MAG: winged helix-turn-helix transcriptional regulator [Alphaproteobacteria bacterium]|nr:winged helix-turn-helix transcriptional regulator [Alphaproteobacteria bacterium]